MAEAIGIAAAAVQFIEISTKLLIAASKLRLKLENAPAKVKSTERSVKQLLSLVERLHTDLQPSSSSWTSLADVLSDPSKLEAENILEDCNREVSALINLLESSIARADDAFLKGKMRAFVYIKKEDEAAERLKRLEELKSHLSIWYHHQSLLLLREQMLAISRTNVAVEAIGNRMDVGFSDVKHFLQPQHPTPSAALQSIADVTRSISFLSQHARIVPPTEFLPDCTCSEPDFRQTNTRIGPFSVSCRGTRVHQKSCPYYGKSQARQSKVAFSFALPNLISRRVDLFLVSTYEGGGISLFPGLRTVNIVDEKSSPAFLRFRHAQKRVQDIFGGSENQPGSLTIAYGRHASGSSEVTISLQQVFEELRSGISEDFRTGTSSAKDVTTNGMTLLHALTLLIGPFGAYQDDLVQSFTMVLQLLIQYGVDVNAEGLSRAHGFLPCGNVLKILQHFLMDIHVAATPHFLRNLHQSGVDLTEWNGSPYVPLLEIGLFPQIPEIAFEIGIPRLSIAVICRNKHELQSLIRSGHDVNETSIKNMSPLDFSIGWLEGMDILLKAGADPTKGIIPAIAYRDISAVERLIEAGAPLRGMCLVSNPTMTRSSVNRLFDSALGEFFAVTRYCEQLSSMETQILSVLTDSMATSRRQPMQLAKENVPFEVLIRHGWEDPEDMGTLLDSAALPVACLLEKLGIHIPASLHPGCGQSVYHEPYLTVEAAEMLFSLGFTEIDVPDKWGCTPLLLCASNTESQTNPDTLSWLLDHGVMKLKFPSLRGSSILYVLAAVFRDKFPYLCGYRGQHHEREFSTMKALLHKISSNLSVKSRDCCICWCSNGGCSPLNLLIKRLEPSNYNAWSNPTEKDITTRMSWKFAIEELELWIDCCDCSPSDEDVFPEVCRLEIFQRLGMAHTCCKFGRSWGPRPGCGIQEDEAPYDIPYFITVKDSERQQLQEEDVCLKLQLDALLGAYSDLHAQFSASPVELWKVWWEVLEDFLPQRVWTRNEDNEYVQLENPWCNEDLPDPQDLWTKTDDIKTRVSTAMYKSRRTSRTSQPS